MKKLTQSGFAHEFLAVAFVVVFAIAGVGYLVASHADTPTPPTAGATAPVTTTYSNNALTLDTTTVNDTLYRGDTNELLMQRDKSGYTQGFNYGPGVTLTSKTATGYELYQVQPNQGQGFYESSGGMSPGQTVKLHMYLNPSKTDGTYTGSYILKYTVGNSSTWINGPTINYTIKFYTSPYTSYFMINGDYTEQTLSRSKAVGGFVYANSSISIYARQLTGFTFYNNQPTQGQGFYESSGGLTKGETFTPRMYLNTNKPNGVYTGTDNLRYQDSTGVWHDGPTVTYKLTLTN